MSRYSQITFVADIENILKSKEIVAEFVSFLKQNKYDYYFPFDDNFSIEDVIDQIKQDTEKFHLQEAYKNIQYEWRSLVVDVPSGQNFTCVLTLYGPRGFFYTPDTVYVNIAFDSVREWVQTMLHEVLHLVHFEETKNMTHSEKEGFIDRKFIDLWGDTFPEYSKQKVSL